MSFVEESQKALEILQAQESLVKELETEMDRLNSEFDALLKGANLKLEDLNTAVDPASLSTEVRALYDAAVEKAERQGKARAGQYETAHGAEGTKAGASRKDIIRM